MMAAQQDVPHIPVMLAEVLEALAPKDGEVYVDGTFGAGGYTRAILDSADCTVVAIDRDPAVKDTAQAFKDIYGERFHFLPGAFGDVKALLTAAGIEKVDGFVLDIGVSSMQLDQVERGFSFRFDGPLDMRMDTSPDVPSAADLVNDLSEKELADIIYKYGEERRSRQVAKAIVEARKEAPITTTGRLAEIVRSVVWASKGDKIDPATRTFQGLRIAVNEELLQLEQALEASVSVLSSGGRLVVVSFHSLEDRIVKKFMRQHSGSQAAPSRHVPLMPEQMEAPYFTLPQKKAVLPAEEEMAVNPRARSAKLRVAVRTDRGA